jgi:hypothetical protein
MLTLRTSDQLRTMRHIKSYRCCPTSTGPPMWGEEWGRLHREELALCIRELRRLGRIYQGMAARWTRELRRRWLAAAMEHRG